MRTLKLNTQVGIKPKFSKIRLFDPNVYKNFTFSTDTTFIFKNKLFQMNMINFAISRM